MKLIFALVLALTAAPLSWGFFYITNATGQNVVWPPGSIPVHIKVDNSAVLSDGTTRATSIQAAMTDPTRGWNHFILNVQFAPQIQSPGNGSDNNGVNEMFFSSSPYNYTWDQNTLAITTGWLIGSQRTEGDVIFNTAFTWDSYRGPLRANGVVDLQRVALHELGHVLGLDHPDEHGQSIAAIMNSVISDLDSLQADDIAGAQGLYGVGDPTLPAFAQQPANQSTLAGTGAQFFAGAVGVPLPTLQWQRLPAGGGSWTDLADGSGYSGVTSALLFVNASAAVDGDQYRCVATNPSGSVTSNAATLSVGIAVGPAFTSVPADQTVNQNQPVTLQVTVTGTPSPTIYWERVSGTGNTLSNVTNDGTYSGASTSSLSFVATAAMNGDQFRCTAFNQVGSAQTNWIQIVVGTKSLPTFAPQPSGQSAMEGTNATVSAGVVSSPAAQVYWQYQLPGSQQWLLWEYWSGINTATLVFPVGLAMNGYQFRCVATNAFGTSYSQPMTLTVTRDPSQILAASVGGLHALFLKPDHSLWAAGNNDYGEIGTASSEEDIPVQIATNVARISAGYGSTYFIKTDNTLWAMGLNSVGQLGDGSTNNRSPAFQVASGVTAVMAGPDHAVFLKSDGTLWGMGNNYNGQLGDGTTTERHSPVQIASGVRTAASGSGSTLFIKTDNTLWATGANGSGQLGDGTTTDRHSPVMIASNVAGVAAGGDFSVFTKSDGTLWAMGGNQGGQLGDSSGLQRNSPVQVATNVAMVSAGLGHAMFVKTDGTLWGMGGNNSGQIGTGGFSNGIYFPVHVAEQVSTVMCGWASTAFVKTDGSLWVCGSDQDGCLGDGAYAANARNPYPTPLELYGPDPVGQAPVFTQQPAGGTFNASDTILLRADATGNPHPTFQWRKDNVNLYQSTDSYLYVYNEPPGSGQYTVVATNASGSVTSQPATIVVQKLNAIGYGANTLPAVVGAGARVIFSATVTNYGTNSWGPTHALWLVDGSGHEIASTSLTNVAPGGTTTVTLTFFAPATPGYYSYYLQGEQTGPGLFQDRTQVLVYVAANTQAAKDDLDGDRLPDLIWQNSVTGERQVWLMGNGEYLSSVPLGTLSPDWSIAGSGDFNGDLHTDLVWQNAVTGERVIWFMNGTSFVSAVSLGVVAPDWSIAAVADFNGDGHPDLAWQNTVTGERTIWLMNGTSYIGTQALPTVSLQWSIAAAADFNGDGKADLVWQNLVTGNSYVQLSPNYGLMNTLQLGRAGPGMVISGAIDFNGDGLQDILWTNTITGERTVWLNTPYNGFTPVSLGTIPPEWTLFHPVTVPPKVGADFNGDLKSDLVWENTTTGERYFWLMNGTDFASSVFLLVVPPEWHIATTGDFDRDGNPDLVWENHATGERYVWLMHGTAFWNNAFLGVISTDWRIAATGDFDGDGNIDLVWQNTATGERLIWLMNGTTFVSAVSLGTIGPEWRIAGSGDFNGDGKADLVWENSSTGELYLWLMNGTSFSSSVYLGTLPPQWRIAGTGDFNHDGQTDLIWQNTSTGECYLWLMAGTSFGSSVFLGVVPVEWQISQ